MKLSTFLVLAKAFGAPVCALVVVLAGTKHTNLTIVAAICSLAFAYSGEIGVLLDRPARQKRIAIQVLQYLMNSTFTIPANHGQTIPDKVSPYRATIMWAGTGRERKRIRPRMRAGFKGEPAEVQTKVYFKENDPIAGIAWSTPSLIQIRDDLLSLADCNNNRDNWRSEWVKRGVPGVVVDHLGEYMTHVRSMLCLGIKFDGMIFVVSIDSVFARAFDEKFFKSANADQMASIVGFLATEVK